SGTTLTIQDVIADQNGSLAGYSTDTVALELQGGGTVQLGNANTYSGGTRIDGATLELLAASTTPVLIPAGTAGAAPLPFAPGLAGTLKIDSTGLPTNPIAGFSFSDAIDLAGVATSFTGATVDADNRLTVAPGETLQMAASDNFGGDVFQFSPDGSVGTRVTLASLPTTFTIMQETGAAGDFSALNNVLAGLRGVVGASITINFGADVTLGDALTAISLGSGSSLTINGANHVLNGNNMFAGLQVTSGNVTIENLTIENARAPGATRFSGGGGGAGLGGGLFVGSSAAVTLAGVRFEGDVASGGESVPGSTPNTGGFGGSGGFGGGAGGNAGAGGSTTGTGGSAGVGGFGGFFDGSNGAAGGAGGAGGFGSGGGGGGGGGGGAGGGFFGGGGGRGGGGARGGRGGGRGGGGRRRWRRRRCGRRCKLDRVWRRGRRRRGRRLWRRCRRGRRLRRRWRWARRHRRRGWRWPGGRRRHLRATGRQPAHHGRQPRRRQ